MIAKSIHPCPNCGGHQWGLYTLDQETGLVEEVTNGQLDSYSLIVDETPENTPIDAIDECLACGIALHFPGYSWECC